jgi:hypothetical protein
MGYAFDFNARPGDPQGQAKMDSFADYIQQNLSPQTLQLIHASGQRRWGIASGQDVSGSPYYAGDYGGHFDHVHWATDVPPIMQDQPAGVDDTIIGGAPGAAPAGFQNAAAVAGGPANQPPPAFANLPNVNQMVGTPHYTGPTLPGPAPQRGGVSNGENVSPQSNFAKQTGQNLASGLGGMLGSLIGNPDFNPRNWQGILHTPEQQSMQHSGGASVQHITQNFDHSIDMSGSTVADPQAMQQQMKEAQNARLYSVLGGLPSSGIGSP